MRDDDAPSDVPGPPDLLALQHAVGDAGRPNLANDALGEQFVPRGYARAVADVLGTRNSSGCWDYGGPKETQSGVDLVKFLARQKWSNGRVGMIGGSYDGTTANMVASRGSAGPRAEGDRPDRGDLALVRLRVRRRRALSSSTPRCRPTRASTRRSAFDFGLARTPPTDPERPEVRREARVAREPVRARCSTRRRATTSRPTTTPSGVERDYRRHAEDFRAAVARRARLAGLQRQAGGGHRALRGAARRACVGHARGRSTGVPLKRMWLTQDSHGSPSGDAWDAMLERVPRPVPARRARPASRRRRSSRREGRTVTDGGSYESTGFRAERAYPGTGTHAAVAAADVRPGRPRRRAAAAVDGRDRRAVAVAEPRGEGQRLHVGRRARPRRSSATATRSTSPATATTRCSSARRR